MKWLAPARLDMLIFKLTDLGVEVTCTLWHFDVDAEGKDISVQDLLMHMERTFGNKRDYDAMIRSTCFAYTRQLW